MTFGLLVPSAQQHVRPLHAIARICVRVTSLCSSYGWGLDWLALNSGAGVATCYEYAQVQNQPVRWDWEDPAQAMGQLGTSVAADTASVYAL